MSNVSTATPKLRALHYLYTTKRQDRFLAHCLNFDLVTAAQTIEEAEDRLDTLVKLYIESALQRGDYASLNTAAPEKYWTLFTEAMRAGRVRKSNRSAIEIKFPDVLPIEQTHSTIAVLAATAAAAA